MEFSTTYVLSQIFIIINYLLIISTYQLHDRKKILLVNLISLIMTGTSYMCLNAYSGMAMVLLGIIRNIMFYVDEKNASSEITPKNVLELIILIVLSIILSIFTYENIWSLMSVVATMTYTISIWQKDTKIYKILGIPVGIAGISYNIYIKSLFGIIFESFSLLSALVGFTREHLEKNTTRQKRNA